MVVEVSTARSSFVQTQEPDCQVRSRRFAIFMSIVQDSFLFRAVQKSDLSFVFNCRFFRFEQWGFRRLRSLSFRLFLQFQLSRRSEVLLSIAEDGDGKAFLFRRFVVLSFVQRNLYGNRFFYTKPNASVSIIKIQDSQH